MTTTKPRVAIYGGSFDPVHNGHIAIGRKLLPMFALDKFIFVPAFHAPHKPHRKPTSAFHRYAMLCLATKDDDRIEVSQMEFEAPEKPYTIDTLSRLVSIMPETDIYFVMGADSWQDIRTWRQWEDVLLLTDHIVVTRPGFPIDFEHVTDAARERIVELRGGRHFEPDGGKHIYITDAVELSISATEIRADIREGGGSHLSEMPDEVAKYIEKYQIYK